MVQTATRAPPGSLSAGRSTIAEYGTRSRGIMTFFVFRFFLLLILRPIIGRQPLQTGPPCDMPGERRPVLLAAAGGDRFAQVPADQLGGGQPRAGLPRGAERELDVLQPERHVELRRLPGLLDD